MKRIFLYTTLIILLFGCNRGASEQSILKIDADSLVANVQNYVSKKVEIEGQIVHICGVDGKKMKLKTTLGQIIKITNSDTLISFDKSLYKKSLKVWGTVLETHIDSSTIDEIEQNRTLLCHIDNMPCKDSAWVERMKAKGVADSMSLKTVKKLRDKMNESHKSFVSTVVILADSIEMLYQ